MPSSDTEVVLPALSVTDCVLVSGKVPLPVPRANCAWVAASVLSPTPSTMAPDGARRVPDCTIVVASTKSAPPADSGACDGPLPRKVMVVGLGPTASRMKVLPLDGYRSAAWKVRLPGV